MYHAVQRSALEYLIQLHLSRATRPHIALHTIATYPRRRAARALSQHLAHQGARDSGTATASTAHQTEIESYYTAGQPRHQQRYAGIATASWFFYPPATFCNPSTASLPLCATRPAHRHPRKLAPPPDSLHQASVITPASLYYSNPRCHT